MSQDELHAVVEELRGLASRHQASAITRGARRPKKKSVNGWTREQIDLVVRVLVDAREKESSPSYDLGTPAYQPAPRQISTLPNNDGFLYDCSCLWYGCQDIITISTTGIRDHIKEKHLPAQVSDEDQVHCGCGSTPYAICNEKMTCAKLPIHISGHHWNGNVANRYASSWYMPGTDSDRGNYLWCGGNFTMRCGGLKCYAVMICILTFLLSSIYDMHTLHHCLHPSTVQISRINSSDAVWKLLV